MKSFRVSWREQNGQYEDGSPKYDYKNELVIAESMSEVADKYPQAESIYLENTDVSIVEDGKKKKVNESGVIGGSGIY